MIDNEKFNRFVSSLNTDYCQNDLFYLYTERSHNVLLENIKTSARLDSNNELSAAIAANDSVKYKHSTISVFPLGSDSLKLISISKKDYITNIMRNFLLLLFGIWFILFLVCIFLSAKITEQFIVDLQKLCKKIDTYAKSKNLNKQRGEML